MNGVQESFWKPLSLSLMTALLVFMTTTWMMWPRDVATKSDFDSLSREVTSSRGELQQLAIQVAGLNERVRIMQLRGTVQ